MKDDMIADIWTMVVEHIPEKQKKEVASDFVDILLDYGIKESVLDNLLGVDPYLDQAIEYASDGKDAGGYDDEEEEDADYYEDED
jgi:hypothetical protein